MATGYARQSAANIVDGNTIYAADLNNEYNAVLNAFHASTGHNHDGTTGGGAPIKSPIVRSAKTATYTVVGTDVGTIIDCTTGTYDVALTAAATLGTQFHVFIYNSGSGTVTINPNGAETIDGQATLALTQYQGAHVFCNGTGFYTIGRNSSQATATGSVTLARHFLGR